MVITSLGLATFRRYKRNFVFDLEGLEELNKLPEKKVLFVANHQTYFAEVILLYHLLCAWKNGRPHDPMKRPSHLLKPILSFYYIAAVETMKSGLLPKLFAYTGSISIKRTWRESGKNVNRKVDVREISQIGQAINNAWVLTFPQGTTTPFAAGRRGTAHLIKKYQPIVVPIVFTGFRDSFDKKGLKIKSKNQPLGIQFKAPMELTYNEDTDDLMDMIMDSIEQSPRFNPKNKENSVD